MSLTGKVALVTGASRGIGKGIALALAKQGARVYITGRSSAGTANTFRSGLDATASEVAGVAAHGGSCVAMVCDHGDDSAVEQVVGELFRKEGRLDVLVNNAFQGLDSPHAADGNLNEQPFWEKSFEHWDVFHRVGLRSHYIASAICARHWVKLGQPALIVNISSMAGLMYTFDVAYGIGKCAVDRLSADCAKELKAHKVAVVSLWPGAVATEAVVQNVAKGSDSSMNRATAHQSEGLFDVRESVEFSGRGIAALASDPAVMRFSGRVLMTPELAVEYGFTDVDGSVPWGSGDIMKLARKSMSSPPSQWRLPKKPAAAKL